MFFRYSFMCKILCYKHFEFCKLYDLTHIIGVFLLSLVIARLWSANDQQVSTKTANQRVHESDDTVVRNELTRLYLVPYK